VPTEKNNPETPWGATTVRLMRRAFLTWLGLAVVMFANGTARVLLWQPWLGEHVARQVATGAGVLIVLGFAFLFVRRLAEPTPAELLGVGTLWLVLTLVFEFGLGYVTGASWEAMLADYDVLAGRLWPLIPAAALVGPWLWGVVLRTLQRNGRVRD
jgi:hypothetical protein